MDSIPVHNIMSHKLTLRKKWSWTCKCLTLCSVIVIMWCTFQRYKISQLYLAKLSHELSAIDLFTAYLTEICLWLVCWMWIYNKAVLQWMCLLFNAKLRLRRTTHPDLWILPPFFLWRHVSGVFSFLPLWFPEWGCNVKHVKCKTSCHIILEKVCVQNLFKHICL